MLIGIAFADNFNVKILAVETGDEFVRGGKIERGADVLPHSGGGGGSKRKTNRFGKPLSHFDDLTILRSEVMPPFRDAVGFVYGNAIDLNRIEKRENVLHEKCFWRNEKQFHIAVADVFHVLLIFVR